MRAILSRTLGNLDDLRMLFLGGDKASLTSLMAMASASRTVLLNLACAHHLLKHFEPQYGAYHPFNGLLVLFNDVIELLD
jgi:hypothetical protein